MTVQRFVREVRLARGIAHPNVCRVYDIGEAEGWHYLSMDTSMARLSRPFFIASADCRARRLQTVRDSSARVWQLRTIEGSSIAISSRQTS